MSSFFQTVTLSDSLIGAGILPCLTSRQIVLLDMPRIVDKVDTRELQPGVNGVILVY
jgi:hypothetical protein